MSKTQCVACKGDNLDSDSIASVVCCSQIFHRSCLEYITSCPFCTVAWGGLRCASCGYYTTSKEDKELYCFFKRRRGNRMICCGADVHFECKKKLSICPRRNRWIWTSISSDFLWHDSYVVMCTYEYVDFHFLAAAPTNLSWYTPRAGSANHAPRIAIKYVASW